MNKEGCDASLSLAHGRAESSRGRMWVQRPLAVPSRTPDKSLESAHSQRKTRPVTTTSSTRIPSPDTCSVSRVGFPAREERMEDRQGRNWKGEQRKTCCIICKVRNPLVHTHLVWSQSSELHLALLRPSSARLCLYSTGTALLTLGAHRAMSLRGTQGDGTPLSARVSGD